MKTEEAVIVALDGMFPDDCFSLVRKLRSGIWGVKIHDLWHRYGSRIVSWLQNVGAERVWVDLKLHDIPKTVKLCARAVRDAGADIVTVHASGDGEMIAAAVETGIHVLGVTVLTSLAPDRVRAIYGLPPELAVPGLARIAWRAGAWGVVCSAQEVSLLNQAQEEAQRKLVVPGTRSPGKEHHDQARVDTPANAVRGGATHLVIGRQLTEARDPKEELARLQEEIKDL